MNVLARDTCCRLCAVTMQIATTSEHSPPDAESLLILYQEDRVSKHRMKCLALDKRSLGNTSGFTAAPQHRGCAHLGCDPVHYSKQDHLLMQAASCHVCSAWKPLSCYNSVLPRQGDEPRLNSTQAIPPVGKSTDFVSRLRQCTCGSFNF